MLGTLFYDNCFIICTGGSNLSSDIQKQLQDVEQLLIHGEFQEGLALIEKNLKKKAISKEEKLGFLVLKSTILNDLGKHEEALETAEKVLKESGETANVLLHVDSLYEKGLASYFVYEDIDECTKCIEKGLEILETTKLDIPEKELAKRKALLFQLKGQFLFLFGNLKEGLKIIEESIAFARKSGDKRTLAWVLLGTAGVNGNKNYAEEAHEIASEIGNKLLLAQTYLFALAEIEASKHNYYEAIELIEKGSTLLDESGSTFLRERLYINLGRYYRVTNQLDKALECFQRALKASRVQSYIMLANIGYIYHLKNKLEEARKYYLKAMIRCEEIKEFRVLPMILNSLVSLSVELEDFAQAQKHLDRLEQLSKETGFEHLSLYTHFASILVLKASREMSKLVEAEKLLREALAKDDLSHRWRLEALYSLLEIRIKELLMSATKEALAEAKKQAIRLEVEAEEQHQRWLLGNAYRLQSQLALIDTDAEAALDLLKKAELIAIETKNDFLKEKVNEDREKINQQLEMLQKLQERKAPISDTVKLASLENTIQSIKEETVLEERDKESGKIIEYRKLFALKI
jgi:tetratricopeptide (TPR) repeat protein